MSEVYNCTPMQTSNKVTSVVEAYAKIPTVSTPRIQQIIPTTELHLFNNPLKITVFPVSDNFDKKVLSNFLTEHVLDRTIKIQPYCFSDHSRGEIPQRL